MMKRKKGLCWLMSVLLLLPACGSRDYGPDEPDKSSPPPSVEESKPRTYQVPYTGYVWRGLKWSGLEDSSVESIKATLRDDEHTNGFCALGATLMGGAVLGLVIRQAGTWILGGPVEVESKSPTWRRIEQLGKTSGQGVLRGGLIAGGCYLLLTGLSPMPYTGFLGHNFRGLSAALVLGGLASIASAPFARSAVEKDWFDPNSKLGQAIRTNNFSDSSIWGRIQNWAATSDLVKYARMRVAPSLLIAGIGSGVGLLVYQGCQNAEPVLNVPPEKDREAQAF